MDTKPTRTLHTLVCRRDLAMSKICLSRLGVVWPERWRMAFWGDESMGDGEWAELREAFPDALFLPRAAVRDRIEAGLAAHPVSLAYYRTHPFATKLLGMPLLYPEGFHYSDGDILVLRKMAAWWPEHALPVVLDEPHVALSSQFKHWATHLRVPLAKRVNAGMMRVPAGIWDLDRVEWFLTRSAPVRNLGVLEQTAWAFLLAGREHVRFDQRTVWCYFAGLPKRGESAAVHFIGGHKTEFGRFKDLPVEEAEVSEPGFYPGRIGSWGYQIKRECVHRWIHHLWVREQKRAAKS
jgi:hypothetical protein